MDTSLWTVFVSEVAGTGMLLLLGCGVVANVILTGTKGFNGGWLLINFGWGLGVFAGVYVAYRLGGAPQPGRHARPAGQRRRQVRAGRRRHVRLDARLPGG